MLERIERVEVGRESRGIRFAFPAPPRTGRRVAALREARKAYGDNVVYAGVAFEVERVELVLGVRSEEHTSELQSRLHLVCRLLLEKKKNERHDTVKW